jgi:hypothetical protein
MAARRAHVLLASVCGLGLVAARARADCRVTTDERGQLDAACLPAISADGARVAVAQPCDERAEPCLAIVFLSVRGKAPERVELAGREREAQLKRANRLLADGKFARVPPLEVPFSATDLNVMTLHAGDVVLRYGDSTFFIDRGDQRLATLELQRVGACGAPWIRSLFLDEKTRTVVLEYEYRDRVGCIAPPGAWRVLRFH